LGHEGASLGPLGTYGDSQGFDIRHCYERGYATASVLSGEDRAHHRQHRKWVREEVRYMHLNRGQRAEVLQVRRTRIRVSLKTKLVVELVLTMMVVQL